MARTSRRSPPKKASYAVLEAQVAQLRREHWQLRHDLLQPLTAARLFASALLERDANATLVRQVSESLADAEKLLDRLQPPAPVDFLPCSAPVLPALDGARIWVLDNDPAICNGMRQLLQAWGCIVVTAVCEAELGDFDGAADVLVVDYHLAQGRTGIEAAAAINAARRVPLPVLMVTANQDAHLKQQLHAMGHALLHKPVAPVKLKAVLGHLLADNA